MIEKEYIEPNEGFSQTVVVKTGNFSTSLCKKCPEVSLKN